MEPYAIALLALLAATVAAVVFTVVVVVAVDSSARGRNGEQEPGTEKSGEDGPGGQGS